jgi:ATP-binding cassette subfamily F protein uup
MHYLTVENVSKSYVENPLFHEVTFHISEGDKMAIVARNGAGKSTLLRIISGLDKPDSGTVRFNKGIHVSLMEQDPVFDLSMTALQFILSDNHPRIRTLKQYEDALAANDLEALEKLMLLMEEQGLWSLEANIRQVLGQLGLDDFFQTIGTMSGGQKKRLSLARVLIEMSFYEGNHLLILDEPTNHLDIDMIGWLADYLSNAKTTLLLVTHDRYFLDNVCNCIVEIENQRMYMHRGDYESYMERKIEREEQERATLAKQKNIFRKELEWMRKQPKARTTKSKSRQDAFHDIEQSVKGKKLEQPLELNMKMSRLGGKVLELKKVYKSFDSLAVLRSFDYTFKKGERIGVIGKNGVGKTTFLNILTGRESADSGKVNPGDTVVFGYFSQSGIQLKEDMRVIEFVRNIAENFPLADGTKLSAAQFLHLFQFEGDKQHTFISKLSGGERKRLQLLSVLFDNPNFLILDEPTNDLDLVTLAVLEDFLENYPGCIVIVSHDRYFMDRLVDHLFVFEGDGIVRDFPGNYTQYRVWRTLEEKQKNQSASSSSGNMLTQSEEPKVAANVGRQKLSFKEKTEWETLNRELPVREAEKKKLEDDLSGGQLSFEDITQVTLRLAEISRELDEMGMRWLELSERAE